MYNVLYIMDEGAAERVQVGHCTAVSHFRLTYHVDFNLGLASCLHHLGCFRCREAGRFAIDKDEDDLAGVGASFLREHIRDLADGADWVASAGGKRHLVDGVEQLLLGRITATRHGHIRVSGVAEARRNGGGISAVERRHVCFLSL